MEQGRAKGSLPDEAHCSRMDLFYGHEGEEKEGDGQAL